MALDDEPPEGTFAMQQKSIFRTVNRRSSGGGLLVFCAVTAATVLLGACSSSGTNHSADASTPGSAGASTSGSGGASNCVNTATANTQAASANVKIEAPPSFDASSMKGKTFAFISQTATPQATQEAEGMKEALTAVGANTQIFYGQGKPDVITQDFQSAIAQQVAGIVTGGIGPDSVPAAYAAAKAAKVPVVAAFLGFPTAGVPDGIVAQVSPSSALLAQIQVDYALAQTKCQLHAAYVYTSGTAINVDEYNAAKAEVTKLCPTDCSLDSVGANVATFKTTMAGQVQTTLQRSPNINFLLTASDTFVPYILQGAKAAGRTGIPIVGALGGSLAAAIAGNGQTADVLPVPFKLFGYMCADAIMRAAAGKTAKNWEPPQRIVDSTNWGTSASDDAQFPELVGAYDAFKKAWGIN
jgi:ribose transport system substrate-binding protein